MPRFIKNSLNTWWVTALLFVGVMGLSPFLMAPTQDGVGIAGKTVEPAQWEDLRVAINGRTTLFATANPDLIDWVGNIKVYAFSPSSDEEVFFSVQVPHSYKLNSELRPHIHWSPTTTGTGNVRWCVEYIVAGVGEAFPGTVTTNCVNAAADGVDKKHQIAEFDAISGTGSTWGDVSTMIHYRLYRDANDAADTYAGDAIGHEFDIHYQIDSAGSRQEYVK